MLSLRIWPTVDRYNWDAVQDSHVVKGGRVVSLVRSLALAEKLVSSEPVTPKVVHV